MSLPRRRVSDCVLVLGLVGLAIEVAYVWSFIPREALVMGTTNFLLGEVALTALSYGFLLVYALLLRKGWTRPWAWVMRMGPQDRLRMSTVGLATTVLLYAFLVITSYLSSLRSSIPALFIGNAVHFFPLFAIGIGAYLSIRPSAGVDEPSSSGVPPYATAALRPGKAYWVAVTAGVAVVDFYVGGFLLGVLLIPSLGLALKIVLGVTGGGGLLIFNTLYATETLRRRRSRRPPLAKA
jgi:hypothetical protein